jgi:hypothetical protein
MLMSIDMESYCSVQVNLMMGVLALAKNLNSFTQGLVLMC